MFKGITNICITTPKSKIIYDKKYKFSEQKAQKLFSKAQIEEILINHDKVQQVTVIMKEDKKGNKYYIAYIVTKTQIDISNLIMFLNESIYPDKININIVPVATIPIDDHGDVDESKLHKVPVLDKELISNIREYLFNLTKDNNISLDINNRYILSNEIKVSINAEQSLKKIISKDVTVQHVATNTDNNTYIADSNRAFVNGGEINIDKNSPGNLVQALIRTAEQYPSKAIIHIGDKYKEKYQTYETLLKRSQCVLNGLKKNNCKKGDKVILQFNDLYDYFPALWGCILGGIIPITVAVPPSYDQSNSISNKLYNVWKSLNFPVLLASESLRSSLTEFVQGYHQSTNKILLFDKMEVNDPSYEFYMPEPSDVAFYQMSSGSTGIPKCIQITHKGIVQHINAAKGVNNYSSDDISLNWLSMDHVVPLLMFHFKDIYLGCQQIQVPTSMILSRPLAWFDLIERYKVTETWSPNFGYNLIIENLAKEPNKKWDLSSIKHFINAGEQVTLTVVKEFLEKTRAYKVTENKMQPAYGMAEMCTAFVYGKDFSLMTHVHSLEKESLSGKLKRVSQNERSVNFIDHGAPVPGIQIRIANKNNEICENDVIGRIQVKGAVRTLGYLNNPIANKEALLDDGWYNTGDLGFLHNGRLTITGREKELIIINGANFFCYDIEDYVSTLENVAPTFVAACGINNDKTGSESLVIFFSYLHESNNLDIDTIKNIRLKIIYNFGIDPVYIIPISKSIFPKTTSGKIQRTKLRENFLEGYYSNIIKDITDKSDSNNTVPDWFYTKIWQKKNISIKASGNILYGKTILIFADESELSNKLCGRLVTLGSIIITVKPGRIFKKSSKYLYHINPDIKQSYVELFDCIQEDDLIINKIIHLYCCYNDTNTMMLNALDIIKAQTLTSLSILFLTQTLSNYSNKINGLEKINFYVISTNCQNVQEHDHINYTKTTINGFIKTIGNEFQFIYPKHIDIDNNSIPDNIDKLLEELQCLDKDHEVAIRNGQRLISKLSHIDKMTFSQNEPFKKGGFYIITGGLGGIGLEVSEFLLREYKIKLLLIGRSPIYDDNNSNHHKEQLARLKLIESNVVYRNVDVCDLDSLRLTINELKNLWQCEIDGVLHLAGIYSPRFIVEEDKENFLSALKPKLLGTWALAQILKDTPSAIFVHFSSVNGYFGGAGASCYASANSFIDAYYYFLNKNYKFKNYHMAWSLWENIGMSKNYDLKTLAKAKGYMPISIKKGILSFIAAMKCSYKSLYIGLDHNNSNISMYVDNSVINKEQLTINIANKEIITHIKTNLDRNVFIDHFGNPIDYRINDIQPGDVNHIPRNEDIDSAAVNELEIKLLQIWKEVLNLSNVGLNDNFFDVGGNSVDVVKIIAKVKELTNKEINLVTLFTYPTIRSIAKFLAQSDEQILNESEYRNTSKMRNDMLSLQRRKRITNKENTGSVEEG